MADCGATGTALDRVARAVTSGAGNGSSKQVFSNLLGHYASSGSQQQSQSQPRMPVAAPEHLPALGVQPQPQRGSRKSQFHVDHDREAGSCGCGCRASSSSTGGAATPSAAVFGCCGTTSFPAAASSADAPPPLPTAAAAATNDDDDATAAAANERHDGANGPAAATTTTKQQRMIQQQQQQQSLQQAEEDVAGHEGRVQPASIEELATAWAEASIQEDG